MAVVISGGTAISSYKPTPVVAASVKLTDTESKTYAELWRTQPQVRKVVGFLARNVAQLGLHAFDRVSDTDRQRVTEHPLTDLLRKPNPFTTPYRFWEAVVSDMAIFDNAVVLKVRLPDQPMALVRLDPTRVQVLGDNPFAPTSYKVDKVEFKPENVIHFRGYSPLDIRWGVSPMDTLREMLAEDRQATLHREQLWRNGARMSGYLKRPLEAPPWTDKGKDRFREGWRQQYTGTGANPGGTPILEDGMDYVAAGTSPRDAQSVEWRKLTREEVASAFHIPLTLVGILDHATYSNVREQHKMLYQDTLGPTLEMIQQELELQLLPDFAGTETMYLEFNVDAKLKGNFEDQAQQLSSSVGGPYMTRNEARGRLNMPQIEDGDQLITPMNLGTATAEAAQLPLVTRDQAATWASLVAGGMEAQDAARLVGMGSIQTIEGVPVTLRTPDELAAGTRRN